MQRILTRVLGPLTILALHTAPALATENLVFHPCQSPDETAFVEVELARGAAPVRDPAVSGAGWDFAVVDLDNDGAPEVAVRPSVACSGHGCGTVVLTRIQGRWVEILGTPERDLNIARRTHRGYREVLSDRGTWRRAGRAYALVR